MRKILAILITCIVYYTSTAQTAINLLLNKSIDNSTFRCKSYKIVHGETFEGGITGHTVLADGKVLLDGVWSTQYNPFLVTPGKTMISLRRKGNMTGIEANFSFQEFNKVTNTWQDACSINVNAPFIGSNDYTVTYYNGFGPNDEYAQYMIPSPSWKKTDGMYINEIDMGGTFTNNTVTIGVGIVTREWIKQQVQLPNTGIVTVQGKIKIDAATIAPGNGYSFTQAIKNTLVLFARTHTLATYYKIADDKSRIIFSNDVQVGDVTLDNIDEAKCTATYTIKNIPLVARGFAYYNNNQQVSYPVITDGSMHFPFWKYVELDGNVLQYDNGNSSKATQPFFPWLNYYLANNATNYWDIKMPPVGNNGTSIVSATIKYIDVIIEGSLNIIPEENNTTAVSAQNFIVAGPTINLLGVVERKDKTFITKSVIGAAGKSRPIINPQVDIDRINNSIKSIQIKKAQISNKAVTPGTRILKPAGLKL